MLADPNNVEILCTESMLDTVPLTFDGPTAMEDIKAEEQDSPLPVTAISAAKPQSCSCPFLTLVNRVPDGLQITNHDYCGESCVESL